MKLSSPSRLQQLLFRGAFGLMVLAEVAQAQAPQAIIQQRGTPPPPAVQGVITGVTPSGVAITTARGSLTVPLASVESVQMAAPLEYAQAMQAIQQKDTAKAANLIGSVANKFKGLPTDWAQQAAALVGDLALQTGDLAKAAAAYADFRKTYPSASPALTAVGDASIAAAKKDFATAKEKIAPVIAAALKEKNVPPESRFAFSRAFLVSGQVKESEGAKAAALEDYLRTVTIYFHDTAAVTAAQERADALRKEKVHVP